MRVQIKRRAFLNSSLKALGLGVTGTALANVCGVETGAQPLGPFFPREGTPVDPIREKPGGPIHLANDSDLTFVDGRPGRATGQVVYVKGQLTGRDCLPVSGATLIAWQASASGRYNHLSDDANSSFRHPVTGETVVRSLDPYFQYWGRGTTDTTGSFLF